MQPIKYTPSWIFLVTLRRFLIFFVFTIVFPLELEARLYYLSIIITTDTAQINCSRI